MFYTISPLFVVPNLRQRAGLGWVCSEPALVPRKPPSEQPFQRLDEGLDGTASSTSPTGVTFLQGPGEPSFCRAPPAAGVIKYCWRQRRSFGLGQ